MLRLLHIILAALVVALSVAARMKQEIILVTGNYSCGVFQSSAPVHLSCGEIAVPTSHTKPPKVDWYIKTNSSFTKERSTFLNDIQYWKQIDTLHMCRYGLNFRRRHPTVRQECSKRKTLKDSITLYSCDYAHIDTVQPAQYRCIISTYEANNRYKIAQRKDIVVKAINPFSVCDLKPTCFMPTPMNMTATLLGNHSIQVMWRLNKRPSYFQCSRPFCNGSRRLEIQLQVFDSVDNILLRPLVKTSWLRTAKRRETFFVMNHSAINGYNYYQYRLRNRNQTPRSSYDPDSRRVRTTKPIFCHFNKQDAAVLQEPAESKVVDVHYGSFINITCHATGLPVPKVKLIYESTNGRNITKKQGVSQVSAIHYNYRRQQRIFYCQSENTIIHPQPCGKLIHSVQVKKITINVI